MPLHYVLHRLKAHPKFNHTKRRLSNFIKAHPKTSSLFSSNPTRNEVKAIMQGEGLRRFPPDTGMHTLGGMMHPRRFPPDTGMHTLGGEGMHRKKLHPLKFKI
jgi:hypothetical protein